MLLAGASVETAFAQAAPSTVTGRAASPAREYREAVAAGDSTRAAAAVMRMWRGRLTEESLRGLNARLKVEADERSVAAVVVEVSRLQNGGAPATAAGAASAQEPNGIKLMNWLASNFRPAPWMQKAPEPPSAAEATSAPQAPRAPHAASAPQATSAGPADETPAKTAKPVRRAVAAAAPKKERVRPIENPALAYETALLRRDPRGMARAVAQLTGAPVTAETVRKLNEEIGAEPDETLVRAVVEAAPAAKTD